MWAALGETEEGWEMSVTGIDRERKSHIWKRHKEDWYQEPSWISERLFAVERFEGPILDPCCGGGNIVKAARVAGYDCDGWDIEDRGFTLAWQGDFLGRSDACSNIAANPPFDIARAFAEHALKIVRHKVALVFPVPRLNAAHWLKGLPLARIWLLTPRPSMPPGDVILRGEKPKGGKEDFCWVVIDRGHVGPVAIDWLHRDGPYQDGRFPARPNARRRRDG
jgi:hypothetical protein